MRRVNCIALNASDSMTVQGAQLDSNQWVSASFQASFGDATAAGGFYIQASNDIDNASYAGAADFTVSNWTMIPNASVTIAAGSSALILVPVCSFRWMRAVYGSNSGGSSAVLVNVEAISV